MLCLYVTFLHIMGIVFAKEEFRMDLEDVQALALLLDNKQTVLEEVTNVGHLLISLVKLAFQ